MLALEWSVNFREFMMRLRTEAAAQPRGSAQSQLLRQIENACRRDITDSVRAYGPNQVLRHVPDVYRWRVGRGRLFYIASHAQQRVIVLHFGQRLAGNPERDAYTELERLLRTDELDLCFASLGIAKPTVVPSR